MVVWFSHTDDYFLWVQILQEYGGVLIQNFWTKYGSSVLSAGLIFQRTSSNEKDSCKGKDRPLNHSSIFFWTHTSSSLKHFQPPPASGANPPEPHLVGGQSHKSVVRFRHFASLPLLHLHGALPPDKLYKNSPNSDKTRPAAAKLCPGPTWWAVPSVGDFIHIFSYFNIFLLSRRINFRGYTNIYDDSKLRCWWLTKND